SSAAEAIEAVTNYHVDGVVLDWVISSRVGAGFIEEMQDRLAPFVPPCIVFGTRKLSPAQAAELHRISRSSLVRYAPSLERLLDETMLLLHRAEDVLPGDKKRILAGMREADPLLAGRKVLLVDDDLRNIFALTSILEQRDLTVLHAEDGYHGIEILQQNPDIDIVLMDVMMPGIDGYETTRKIRGMPQFDSLPVIALTAKAMKGDREKCLAAGASDYVAKPVDLDHLFSVMRVWLARALDNAPAVGERSGRA
ncbi:MAG: response regulator, partial [Bryobacteraceae bacterium]